MKEFIKKIYLRRNYIAIMHDGVMAALSFIAALYLRFESHLSFTADYFVIGLPLFLAIAVATFSLMRLYKGLWRYASLQDLLTIIKASSLVILIFLMLMFLVTRLETMPRSVLFINWLLLIVFLGGPRFIYRLIKDRELGFDLFSLDDSRIPVLLVGAGDRAELFLRDTSHISNSMYRVVGIVDDDRSMHGRNMRGVRVYGGTDSVAKVIDKLERKGAKPQRIIITSDDFKGDRIRTLLQISEGKGVLLSRLPSLTEFKSGSGREKKSEPRPVAIEDLLGRPQNDLNYEVMRDFINGRRVAITGGGGTIGLEIARQVASFNPQSLTVIDNSEFNLYEASNLLKKSYPEVILNQVFADVRDRDAISRIFSDLKPEIVFHAAAIKHVPIAEDNPEETVLTNVFGTINVARCAVECGVREVVMISTDKAVNPSGVMGATKRLAEIFMQSFAGKGAGQTRFAAVRFGNVLASRGSVIPMFQQQLAAGGPITITHADVTRYFMTLREAVGLVILASTLAAKEEIANGSIFVLEMGQPIRIRDMAEQMIKLSGLRPGVDVEITVTGLRPGEKLYEELFYFAESPAKTDYEGILIASPAAADFAKIEAGLARLERLCIRRDGDEVKQALTQMLQ